MIFPYNSAMLYALKPHELQLMLNSETIVTFTLTWRVLFFKDRVSLLDLLNSTLLTMTLWMLIFSVYVTFHRIISPL